MAQSFDIIGSFVGPLLFHPKTPPCWQVCEATVSALLTPLANVLSSEPSFRAKLSADILVPAMAPSSEVLEAGRNTWIYGEA